MYFIGDGDLLDGVDRGLIAGVDVAVESTAVAAVEALLVISKDERAKK